MHILHVQEVVFELTETVSLKHHIWRYQVHEVSFQSLE